MALPHPWWLALPRRFVESRFVSGWPPCHYMGGMQFGAAGTLCWGAGRGAV